LNSHNWFKLVLNFQEMVIFHIIHFNLLKIRRKWFKFTYFVSIVKNGLNWHTSFQFIKIGLVVPPEDADAGDVRAYYPATATCLGPRQDPTGRDVPVRRDQTADTAVRYDTENILNLYDFSL
jgi:hypothetical protein